MGFRNAAFWFLIICVGSNGFATQEASLLSTLGKEFKFGKIQLELVGASLSGTEGLGRSLRKNRLPRLVKMAAPSVSFLPSKDSFIYIYDYRGSFLHSPHRNQDVSPSLFEPFLRKVIENPQENSGAMAAGVFTLGELTCLCKLTVISQDRFRQGFIITGRLWKSILQEINSNLGAAVSLHIGDKKLMGEGSPPSGGDVSTIKIGPNQFLKAYQPPYYATIDATSGYFLGGGVLILILGIMAACGVYGVILRRGFQKDVDGLIHAVPAVVSPTLEPVRDQLHSLAKNLRKQKELVKYNKNQLAQLEELGQIRDWEFTVFINRVRSILDDHEMISQSFRDGSVSDTTTLLATMIQHASIITNYSRLYGFRRISRAGNKIKEKLQQHRAQALPVDKEFMRVVDDSYFDVMFLLDSYITLREILLGGSISESNLTYMTPLQVDFVGTCLLPGVVSEASSELSKSINFVFQENIKGHLQRYNDMIEQAANEGEKKVNNIVFHSKRVLFERDEWVYLNEIIINSLLFLVKSCLESPGKRRQSGASESGLVEFEVVDLLGKNKHQLTVEIDGNNLNLESIMESGVKNGIVDYKDFEDLSYQEKWRRLAKVPGILGDRKTGEDHFGVVSDLVSTLGGELELDVSPSRVGLQVSWNMAQSVLTPPGENEITDVVVPGSLSGQLEEVISKTGLAKRVKLWPLDAIDEFLEEYAGSPAIFVFDPDTVKISRNFQVAQGDRIVKVFLASDLSELENRSYGLIKGQKHPVFWKNLPGLLRLLLEGALGEKRAS